MPGGICIMPGGICIIPGGICIIPGGICIMPGGICMPGGKDMWKWLWWEVGRVRRRGLSREERDRRKREREKRGEETEQQNDEKKQGGLGVRERRQAVFGSTSALCFVCVVRGLDTRLLDVRGLRKKERER